MLSGNIKTDVENQCPLWDYRHLFQPLPEELREDAAFLDRVHAYLPGWEMPVIALPTMPQAMVLSQTTLPRSSVCCVEETIRRTW